MYLSVRKEEYGLIASGAEKPTTDINGKYKGKTAWMLLCKR